MRSLAHDPTLEEEGPLRGEQVEDRGIGTSIAAPLLRRLSRRIRRHRFSAKPDDRADIYDGLAAGLSNDPSGSSLFVRQHKIEAGELLLPPPALRQTPGALSGRTRKRAASAALEEASRSGPGALEAWIPPLEFATLTTILGCGCRPSATASALRRLAQSVRATHRWRSRILASVRTATLVSIAAFSSLVMIPLLAGQPPSAHMRAIAHPDTAISVLAGNGGGLLSWIAAGELVAALLPIAILWSLPQARMLGSARLRDLADRLPPWRAYRRWAYLSWLGSLSAIAETETPLQEALQRQFPASPRARSSYLADRIGRLAARADLALGDAMLLQRWPDDRSIRRFRAVVWGPDNGLQALVDTELALYGEALSATIERFAIALQLLATALAVYAYLGLR